jgi:hypothetical protein
MPKKWSPGMPLPPWSGNDDAMRAWVFYQLENFYYAREGTTDPESDDATILELLDSSDRQQARRGHGATASACVPATGA